MTILDRLRAAVAVTVKYFLVAREFLGGVFHPLMPAIYVVSILISGMLVWFTIYCISASNYMKSKVVEKYMDMFGVGDVGKYRQLKAWKNVVKRMKTNVSSNWKIAILEADHIMDEVIKGSGYRGATTDERFAQAEPNVFSNLDQLRAAHALRNRVMREPDYNLTKEEALQMLRVYQQAFKENGLLD